jgi:hypothetical protein
MELYDLMKQEAVKETPQPDAKNRPGDEDRA